jgi:MFS family permease
LTRRSFALLRDNADFRRLWLADLTSLFGDWFNWIALYTAADGLLGTSQAIAWVIVAKSLPVLLVSPLAGPLVDRMPARTLMIASDLIRAGLALSLLLALHLESVVLLYALTVLSMACSGVFLPAKTAAVPRLVERDQIGLANSLTAASWSVTLAFGAALGGLVTATFGVAAAFVADAATYLVSAAVLSRLPAVPPPAAEPGADGAVAASPGFVAGLRYLRRARRVAPLALLKSGMACTSGAIPMLPLLGNRVFGDGQAPALVGLLFAARGVGAAAGSLTARSLAGETPVGLRRTAVAGFAVLALGYTGLGLAPAMLWACLALVVAGYGNSMIWVGSSVALQTEVDRAYHGRVFSLDFGAMTVTQSVWIVASTTLVDAGLLGPQDAVLCSAAVAIPVGVGLAVCLRPLTYRR